jgi:galactokinase
MGARGAGEGAASAAAPEALLALHARRFEQRFGRGPGVRVCFAPGRVNLQGAHLDYNGGPVMPMAIDRGTFLAVRPRKDAVLSLHSTTEHLGRDVELKSLADVEAAGSWTDYPAGVARGLARQAREAGVGLQGLDVLYGGDLPVGAGLSSSASICVGTAVALDTVWDLGLRPMQRVELALEAEREFVGVQCGIMDPYAVGLARPEHILWLDCKDRSWTHLPIEEGLTVAVADTGVRRELARSEFNRRVAQVGAAFEALRPHAPDATCLRDVPAEVLREFEARMDPELARRAWHVVDEVERTFRARAALLAGDVATFGRCMSESQVSLREQYEVSVPELDCLVDAALEHESVLGSRLTGAGFGGCVVILVRDGQREGLAAHLRARFEAAHGHTPSIEFYSGDRGPREVAHQVSS